MGTTCIPRAEAQPGSRRFNRNHVHIIYYHNPESITCIDLMDQPFYPIQRSKIIDIDCYPHHSIPMFKIYS